MLQVRQRPNRTVLDPHAVSCEAYAELVRGVTMSEPLGAYFRKARSLSQLPNPLARVFRDVERVHAVGGPESNLRIFGVAFTSFVDGLCGVAARLDFESLRQGVELENSENAAEFRVTSGHRDPATLRAFARAKRREAIHDLMLADAADLLASQGMRA